MAKLPPMHEKVKKINIWKTLLYFVLVALTFLLTFVAFVTILGVLEFFMLTALEDSVDIVLSQNTQQIIAVLISAIGLVIATLLTRTIFIDEFSFIFDEVIIHKKP